MEKSRVLLADDDEATCALLKALLADECTVDVAYDGVEAISKLRSGRYAAVILDLLMPHTNGYGVLDFLLNEKPETLPNVLVVTASISPKEMDHVSRYPVRCVIAKPFDIETLRNVIRDCLSKGPGLSPTPTIVVGGMILLLADLLPFR